MTITQIHHDNNLISMHNCMFLYDAIPCIITCTLPHHNYPENMFTKVFPKEYDQKCSDFGELFRLERTAANTGISVFSQFRSKSTLGYFCCWPFPKFRAFWDRCKTDSRVVNSLGISYIKIRLGSPFWNVQKLSKFRKRPTTKICQFRF